MSITLIPDIFHDCILKADNVFSFYITTYEKNSVVEQIIPSLLIPYLMMRLGAPSLELTDGHAFRASAPHTKTHTCSSNITNRKFKLKSLSQ